MYTNHIILLFIYNYRTLNNIDKVIIIHFVGVDTTNSTSKSQTGNLSFLTQSIEIKE